MPGINLSANKLTVKTKLAFGIGATGEGATNWIFAGLGEVWGVLEMLFHAIFKKFDFVKETAFSFEKIDKFKGLNSFES